MELFNSKNNWYKGNLHTHTKLSDGILEPLESINKYKEAGYDFIAITDHRKVYRGMEDNSFLILSGIEFDINDYSDNRKAWHIVGINIDDSVSVESILNPKEETVTPQYYINNILDNNGIAILAHPAWSLLTSEDIMSLNGHLGFEIWNTVSETKSNRGDSTIYLDIIAAQGKYPLIFAADDTHFYNTDLFGGYIMVNSQSLKNEDIINNIKSGNFYCSQGPKIKQITIEEKEVIVESSPVESIAFMTDTFYCQDRIAREDGKLITKAKYRIKETDRYIRVECKSADNKKAWSQIVPI